MRALVRWCLGGCLLFGGVIAAPGARGDQVVLTNGDRISGSVVRLVEGVLVLDSELVGALEIATDGIRTLQTDEPVELHLADGTVLRSALVPLETGGVRTVESGAASARTHSLAEATAINPPPQEPPAWHGKLLAGAKFERGNTIKDSGHIHIDAERETDADRIFVKAHYLGERTTDKDTHRSTTNDRNLFAELGYDHYLTERLFAFTLASGERDGPADLDLRFILGGGLGVHWWDTPESELRTRFGLTWTREDFRHGDREDKIATLLAWDSEHLLSQDLSFFHEGSWLQSLEAWDDRLVKTATGLRNDLTQSLFLEAKVLWEWDAEPASNTERQDVDYIFGVGYAF